MAKYKKKPIVIEAIQLKEGKGLPFVTKAEYKALDISNTDGRYKIKTLEGWYTVYWNDWIIKGIQGEFYPCKPDIFKATYTLVKEEENK